MEQNDTIVIEYGLSLIQILDLDERNQILSTNVWATYVSTVEGLETSSPTIHFCSKTEVHGGKTYRQRELQCVC